MARRITFLGGIATRATQHESGIQNHPTRCRISVSTPQGSLEAESFSKRACSVTGDHLEIIKSRIGPNKQTRRPAVATNVVALPQNHTSPTTEPDLKVKGRDLPYLSCSCVGPKLCPLALPAPRLVQSCLAFPFFFLVLVCWVFIFCFPGCREPRFPF